MVGLSACVGTTLGLEMGELIKCLITSTRSLEHGVNELGLRLEVNICFRFQSRWL